MMRIGRALATGTVILAIAILTACSNGGSHTATATPAPSVPQGQVSSPTAATANHFGDIVKWDDGVSVTILQAMVFTPNVWSIGGNTGDIAVKLQVRISNDSAHPLDLGMSSIALKAGPGGDQCDNIISSEDGLMDFTGTIAPGHSATTWYGYSVPKQDAGQQLDFEVSPGYDAGLNAYTTYTIEGHVPFKRAV